MLIEIAIMQERKIHLTSDKNGDRVVNIMLPSKQNWRQRDYGATKVKKDFP